ncbi:heterokaryon incompatibility protein-domain-containing protein [Boletus edulis BED1]|uniref:Heterokaryon incompatibility protein-domain-containing protein n=1 Tax=Boletus edulis BED1 TaxID=1328754 RepID=A0AAD4GJ15_BOLED|nr:heterokaryon incompatibility protein-domain-containing protein [Boletus edulis BED1]
MEASASNAKLCDACSRLDIHRLTQSLHPCRNPLRCSKPPNDTSSGIGLALGSIDEIKSRRLTCDICRLVAESLDKEPPDLDGECRVVESEEYCRFKLPISVEARDPSITHFHLTQASVVFYTSELDRYHGPALPWESKEKSTRSSHNILDFQVRASSCLKAGDTTVASPQMEQEFLATIGGRYICTQVDIHLIRAWLHQCEHKHGKDCMPSLRFLEGIREPIFVVDVIQSCLVDTPSRCRYVALSYVWGTAPVFTHLTENTQDLRKTCSLRSLPIPATIRDAIALVYAIGERYLWVDSLCIIQDNWKMKGTEITRMGSIYSGALFTIVAAAGDHANSGLPGIEQGTRDQVQKILKLADCELLTVIDKTPHGIDNTTWAERAWTFQERVLSNRVLVFSESQVYWSCRVASHSEERALEEVRNIDCIQSPFPQQVTADRLSWEPLEPLKYFKLYQGLLSTYRQRHMTYKSDILNAFDGVSETLAALQNDTFLWGHPESLFSHAMSWHHLGHSARNHVEVPILDSNGSRQMIPIPSWSWAAWSGVDLARLPYLNIDYNVKPVIHFDIVDSKRQLVRIKEQSWPDHPGDGGQALWKNEHPDQVQPDTNYPPLRAGQLRFWTSLGNMKVVQERSGPQTPWTMYLWRLSGVYQPDQDKIVGQDMIVVAANLPNMLTLLAIEWKDGVAYRVGRFQVPETEWLEVENRQWRLITLG